MAIVELYSKRQKRLRGDVPDVYTYDDLPRELREQIVYIWSDTLGTEDTKSYSYSDVKYPELYAFIVNTLCREYGMPNLPTLEKNVYNHRMYASELKEYFLQLRNYEIEEILNIVELSFRVIKHSSNTADEAIEELNHRFKEHGVGYQFVEDQIIRTDSKFIHSEVVKPVLSLLTGEQYQGAQQEFLTAHEHYRHGRHKDALNECLKAFESTMKAICDKQAWEYRAKITAKELIKKCFDNKLVPSFWQQQFDSLYKLLSSSIAPVRNELSSHGQGSDPTTVPDYLVAYVLHMTASTLLFLITAEQQLN